MSLLHRHWLDDDEYYWPSEEELKRKREEQEAKETAEALQQIQQDALESTRAFLFTVNEVVYLLPEMYREYTEVFRKPVNPQNAEKMYAEFHNRFKVFDFSLMRNIPLNVRVNTEEYQKFQKIAWYRKQRIEDYKLEEPEKYGIKLR